MVRSSRFGSIRNDITPYSDSLSLGLRIFVLNPPFPISRRLILQQARGQVQFPVTYVTVLRPPTACQHTVSCSISLPLRGFSFNFPSLYYFAIGHLGVFSLTRWSSLIHTGFHVPHATRDKTDVFLLLTTGLSPSMVQDSAASSRLLLDFQCTQTCVKTQNEQGTCFPTTPILRMGLGCSHFARRYFGNRVCFLFLQLLRCFNSLSCLLLTYEFSEQF